MRRVRITTLALLGVALVLSGCGSSSKTLTRAELIRQANAICQRVNTEISALNRHPAQNLSDIGRIAPQMVPFEQAGLAELSKLSPPSELAKDWKEVLTYAQTLADDTAKLGEYARNKQIKALRASFTSSETIQANLIKIAKRDNLGACEKMA